MVRYTADRDRRLEVKICSIAKSKQNFIRACAFISHKTTHCRISSFLVATRRIKSLESYEISHNQVHICLASCIRCRDSSRIINANIYEANKLV